jgi:ABC-type polysaccharide/polyol phosphate transport system ATPase subunit
MKKICNRLVMIDEGKVKAIGDPDEVIAVYSS